DAEKGTLAARDVQVGLKRRVVVAARDAAVDVIARENEIPAECQTTETIGCRRSHTQAEQQQPRQKPTRPGRASTVQEGPRFPCKSRCRRRQLRSLLKP